MIFPVGVACFVAKVVGNRFNHGLYHQLIDIQSMPYLPDSWKSEHLPSTVRVRDMMPSTEPVVIPVNGGRESIKQAIDGNLYSGFPVVDDQGAVVGYVERDQLVSLLEQPGEVDVADVTDYYPVTVRVGYPLQMAFQLFKSMEMTSLIVVDENHRPLTVMTRFAFLEWRVAERLGSTRLNELLLQEQMKSRRVSNVAYLHSEEVLRDFSMARSRDLRRSRRAKAVEDESREAISLENMGDTPAQPRDNGQSLQPMARCSDRSDNA